MGYTQHGSTSSMAILTVSLFIFSFTAGVLTDAVIYKSYPGLDRKIEMSSSVATAMSKLNRYHGHGSYHYTPTYYRPNHHGHGNLGTLLSPVVFGLATAATVAGGEALVSSLFPTSTIVGRK